MEDSALLAFSSWQEVISQVLRQSAHRDIHLSKENLPHLESIGISRGWGIPRGQSADYRMPSPDGRSIHIREYRDHYAAHWDEYDPATHLVQHIRCDARNWWMLLAGFIGYKISGNRWRGGLLGVLLGRVTRG